MSIAADLSRSDWQSLAGSIAEMRSAPAFAQDQFEELVKLLEEGAWNAGNFWVGELAAELIRERGDGAMREELLRRCGNVDDWPLHFFLVALRDAAGWPLLEPHVRRAAACAELPIKTFADAELRRRSSSPSPGRTRS